MTSLIIFSALIALYCCRKEEDSFEKNSTSAVDFELTNEADLDDHFHPLTRSSEGRVRRNLTVLQNSRRYA